MNPLKRKVDFSKKILYLLPGRKVTMRIKWELTGFDWLIKRMLRNKGDLTIVEGFLI